MVLPQVRKYYFWNSFCWKNVSYWRESSIFPQINQVTEECSISGFSDIYVYVLSLVRFPFPYSQLMSENSQNSNSVLLKSDLYSSFFPTLPLWRIPLTPQLSLPPLLCFGITFMTSSFTDPVSGFFWLAFWTCLILHCSRPDRRLCIERGLSTEQAYPQSMAETSWLTSSLHPPFIQHSQAPRPPHHPLLCSWSSPNPSLPPGFP